MTLLLINLSNNGVCYLSEIVSESCHQFRKL